MAQLDYRRLTSTIQGTAYRFYLDMSRESRLNCFALASLPLSRCHDCHFCHSPDCLHRPALPSALRYCLDHFLPIPWAAWCRWVSQLSPTLRNGVLRALRLFPPPYWETSFRYRFSMFHHASVTIKSDYLPGLPPRVPRRWRCRGDSNPPLIKAFQSFACPLLSSRSLHRVSRIRLV